LDGLDTLFFFVSLCVPLWLKLDGGFWLVTKPGVSSVFAAGVYLPEGRQPIIPLFHHSIIPIVSEAN
jgi:hypothetical protein